MSSVSLVKKAADCFKLGDYKTALGLYLRAANIYGEKLFQANIEICKRKLRNVAQVTNDSVLNEYFDHIYVVNLESQFEKRIKVSNQLKNAGIKFELFPAVNGYTGEPRRLFDDYMLNPIGNLKRYPEFNAREVQRGSKFIESAGAVGYIFTYLAILKDAKAKGYKKFLILEDDIILSGNFEQRFLSFLSGIDIDWKVLQLGASQYGWDSVDLQEAKLKGYYKPRRLDTCGSFAIGIDASIIDELIVAESAFDAPFDHLPLGEIYEKYLDKCYVIYPNIIMPDVGDSTIRGGRCQYGHSELVKWKIEDFTYPLPRPSVAVILTGYENLKYYENFSSSADMPVELRLFYTSKDGLRPLHNKSMLTQDYVFDESILEKSFIPKVDFCAKLSPQAVLTESDIVSFVEYELGLRLVNNTPLELIDISFSSIKKGRVSVVIPTYKRPENLKNALISVLEQEYPDVEVLVVSDNGVGSPYNDETRIIINELKLLYPSSNLKLIEHFENRNGAAARNTAIMASSGEHISFLDDDDIYLPGRIDKSIQVLRGSRGEVGAVYCGFLGWNSPVNDLNRYKEGDLTLEIFLLDYKKHYLHTNTATYKRESVIAINGFDESYRRHQDLEFNLRFFELYKISTVKDALVRLNPAPSDISNKIFGHSMLELKLKFLDQFETAINGFDEKFDIYSKHWDEVIRYTNDESVALGNLINNKKNGYLQVYHLLLKNKPLE